MNPIVVSVAWGEKYVEVGKNLERSCLKYGYLFDISFRKEAPKDVRDAKRQKPEAILHALVSKTPVLWIDADAEIVAPLVFPEGIDKCDMAAFKTGVWESTVLYFNPTGKSFRILDAWSERLEDWNWDFDSAVLTDVVKELKADIITLSPELCWTEFFLRNSNPDAKPMIVHHAFLSAQRIEK